jgi:hypothetical protein
MHCATVSQNGRVTAKEPEAAAAAPAATSAVVGGSVSVNVMQHTAREPMTAEYSADSKTIHLSTNHTIHGNFGIDLFSHLIFLHPNLLYSLKRKKKIEWKSCDPRYSLTINAELSTEATRVSWSVLVQAWGKQKKQVWNEGLYFPKTSREINNLNQNAHLFFFFYPVIVFFWERLIFAKRSPS